MEHEKGLLEGIVILDLTRVLAGPYCGALLADMGATVIKVEQPGKGDDSRSMGPFINDQSVYFANFNRSKMGVTLNLKAPEAKEIFKEMVKKADVVIENYRPGTMEKLGLGYDVLKEINPGIIYGACSGFGHTGPYSKRAGYDIVGQAMGGLMSTTGWPGGPATRCGTPMGDVLGGLNLTVGVLAALAAAGVDPLMPWLLSFAAGAMLYVVVEELIPQAHSRAGTCGFVMGFLVMMVLDVALGG